MNIEKLDPNVYYYTDLVTKEEQDYVLSVLKNFDQWVRVYNDGHEYDPNSDRSKPRSVMLAYRGRFDTFYDDGKLKNIINKAFQTATKHYREDRNIVGGNDYPEYFGENFHIDRHEIGTTYMAHVDSAPINTECYTVLLYINDDYDGGELSFTLPKKDKNVKVVNGILSEGPNGFFAPDAPENQSLVDFWVKPKAMSIIIFPPLYPYPHVAHEVTGSEKYLIKGFWQVSESRSVYWSSSPYDGRSEENIIAANPEGFVYEGREHQIIKSGIDIVAEEYKEWKL